MEQMEDHVARGAKLMHETPSFLVGLEEAHGAITAEGEASIFDEQFVVLADGSGKGREQQDIHGNMMNATGKLNSNMFYQKKNIKENIKELEDTQERRKGLFSAGGQDASDSQMLPELNLSRR